MTQLEVTNALERINARLSKVKSTSVLLIDDDGFSHNDFKRAMQACGAPTVVRCANSGPYGIARIDQGDVDIVFIDLCMPDMDGVTVIRVLRQEGNDLPIVAISDGENSQLIDDAIRLGAWMHIEKPITTEKLTPIFTRYQLI